MNLNFKLSHKIVFGIGGILTGLTLAGGEICLALGIAVITSVILLLMSSSEKTNKE
ncbi:MAG: hypothetical protein ABH859_02005 [Pseudomonadota bacterium]